MMGGPGGCRAVLHLVTKDVADGVTGEQLIAIQAAANAKVQLR